MIEPSGTEPAVPRARLRVGGISLARHQLGIALGLGCERIVCIARGFGPELVELQQVVEKHGGRFHVVSGSRGLTGLITANDELIVLTDGLFAEPDEAVSQLEAGQGVIVQPIEVGAPAGFERIDLNHAAAGAMRMPGQLVERIAELPADCDVVSSLQRIALQAGVPQRMLPHGPRGRGTWRLVRDEGEAQVIENEWFRQNTEMTTAGSASDILALVAVRSVGPALMYSGSGSNTIGVLALIGILLAVGTAWFQLTAMALFLCALAEVLCRSAALLAGVERRSLSSNRSIVSRKLLFGWVVDLALIFVMSFDRSVAPSDGLLGHFFPAVMLVVMLRLIPQLLPPPWTQWLEDRGLWAVLLGLWVVMAGAMPVGLVAVSAVALGLIGVLRRSKPAHLTRV